MESLSGSNAGGYAPMSAAAQVAARETQRSVAAMLVAPTRLDAAGLCSNSEG